MQIVRVEFRLLGPVACAVDGRWVRIDRRQERCVLAILLLEAGRPVPVERLIELTWGDEPPPSARNALRTHISRLRAVLSGPVIASTPGHGYVLRVERHTVDAHRFEALVDRAETVAVPAERATLLRQALALWRGPALADIGPDRIRLPLAARLEQRRQRALESRIDADLAAGRHADLIGELAELSARSPLDEGMAGRLMLALYRAGRRPDSLAVFRSLQERLRADIGLDPGKQLQDLQVAVLRDDPRLQPAAAVPDRPVPHVPAQLPADVSSFTGRGPELDRLDALLTGTDAAVAVVSGTAGVGKTALAVHWAHRAAGRFPDGQLYVNLRGYDPDRPLAATDALARMLGALGRRDQDIPFDLDQRAALYRTLIADRRALIVLDNASTAEQVRPLLPGTAGCPVLVTSRDSLAGLAALRDVGRLHLDPLPAADALDLLKRLAAVPVSDDPGAAAVLVEQCARLPLALRIAAELVAANSATPLAELVRELADRRRRLDLLDAGGDPYAAVAVVFSWSVRHLPAAAARTFALLGLHPGPDVDVLAVAALAGTDVPATRSALAQLARAHLVHRTESGRYGMHDLLRAYAARLAESRYACPEPPTGMFDFYLGASAVAADLLYPAEAHWRPRIAAPDVALPDLPDPVAARVWLETERATLVAVVACAAEHGRLRHAGLFSTTLFRYFSGGYPAAALVVHRHAVDAARRSGDPLDLANAQYGSGNALLRLARYEQSVEHLREALDVFRRAGDLVGAARTLIDLGAVDRRLGRYAAAEAAQRRALDLFREVGDGIGQARAWTALGIVAERLGRYDEAAARHQRALDLLRHAGDRNGEANALNSLGLVEQRRGRPAVAAGHHERALALYRRQGDISGEAHALDNLGSIHTAAGHTDAAADHHRQALTLFRAIGEREGEAWACNGLGEAALAAARPVEAVAHHSAAVAIAAGAGDRHQQARACLGLGHAERDLGRFESALEQYRRAVALYEAIGAPGAEEARAGLAACRTPA